MEDNNKVPPQSTCKGMNEVCTGPVKQKKPFNELNFLIHTHTLRGTTLRQEYLLMYGIKEQQEYCNPQKLTQLGNFADPISVQFTSSQLTRNRKPDKGVLK